MNKIFEHDSDIMAHKLRKIHTRQIHKKSFSETINQFHYF